jgi:hypothetical protein
VSDITSPNLPIFPKTYVCLFFRQNGGDGLFGEKGNPIPQLFHIALWIWKKSPFRTNFFRQGFDPPFLNSQFEDATLMGVIRMGFRFHGACAIKVGFEI